MYNCHSGVVPSTHIRASNIISREPYEMLTESETGEAAPEILQDVEPHATSPRNENENGTDDVLHNVMRQVDAEIRQCLDRGKPLTSILRPAVKPRGRARRLLRQPFTEHPVAANGGPQTAHSSERAGGGSSSCFSAAMAAERWLQTPHVVSVTRGMSGTQRLQRLDDARVRQAYQRARWLSRAQRFSIALDMDDPDVQRSLEVVQPLDFQLGPKVPPVHIDGIDPDTDEEDPTGQC